MSVASSSGTGLLQLACIGMRVSAELQLRFQGLRSQTKQVNEPSFRTT